MIHNVDISDGLNNGAKGKVLSFIKNDDAVTHIMVEFDDENTGKALKESSPIKTYLKKNKYYHLNAMRNLLNKSKASLYHCTVHSLLFLF